MSKCWRCKRKANIVESVGVNVANEKDEWTWYTRFLCKDCISEFGAYRRRKKISTHERAVKKYKEVWKELPNKVI